MSENVLKLFETRSLSEDAHALIPEVFDLSMRLAAAHGLTLTIEDDFELLLEVNRRHARDSWYPMIPIFDPRVSELGEAFWISGRDSRGEVMVAQCARYFDWQGTTCKAEMESLRLIYSDPQASAFPEEMMICEVPAARYISGRVCYSGGAWFHPEYRGKQISRYLPRLSRLVGHCLWDSDYTISVVVPELVEKGVVARYGYSNVEGPMEWRHCFRGHDVQVYLLWMDEEELWAEIEDWLSETRAAYAANRN